MIGGAIGGWAYGLKNKLPSAAGADAAAFGMLLGLAIGRVGDIINGEHFARTTDLPWAIYYSNVNSPGFFRDPSHPAVAYELLGDLVILGVIALIWKYWRPKSGVIFCTAFLLYAIMRFFVSFLRLDSDEPALGLSTPQLVSLGVIAIVTPLLVFFLRREDPGPYVAPTVESRRRQASRAERRRRLRGT
jgi:phosphatidylglycerol:prolipoprotein diacylglycerol transferase